VAARALGESVWSKFPFVDGMEPISRDGAQLLLNQAWRPALAVTGLEGAPPLGGAGNVLRTFTAAKLSLRLPPTVNAEQARTELKALLERDPPYGARVTCELEKAGSGWNAPPLSPWLEAALDRGSQMAFGKGVAMVGEGGSIPLMGMLADMFPAAQFVITGVLGPSSNAHGPDEFLHLAMVKGVTVAMAEVLAAHAQQTVSFRRAA
jgi:acetylornithine deacetylase/succinyl-diaminopimelate desuccinylase-like protein